MKHVFYTVLLLLLAVFQALAPSFWFGVKPNLVLLFVLGMAILEGPIPGMIYAVAGGMILDMLGFMVFGVNTLFLLYFAIACSLLYGVYFTYNYIVGVLFVGGVSVLYEFFYYFFNFFLWGGRRELSVLVDVLLPEALYNIVFSFLVFYLMMQILKRCDTAV